MFGLDWDHSTTTVFRHPVGPGGKFLRQIEGSLLDGYRATAIQGNWMQFKKVA